MQTDSGIRSKPFPIMSDGGAAPSPTGIPWSVADKAYSVYRAHYGTSQTLERLAERGGFGADEMDTFYPAWRDEVNEIAKLQARMVVMVAALHEAAFDYRAMSCNDGSTWRVVTCYCCGQRAEGDAEATGPDDVEHEPDCVIGRALASDGG